ncbi:hypothetical protein BIY24_03510 [Halobacteriovorax marinus]|uniref:Membrane protein n=1 Tax=Halobacteriovorax marinus (strain ATCC BAA-682 / DSM 15412 / SJ) TaxID=862908 RepID=E1X5P6_HALMS|nr:ABC transporter permease [Halobacteriovorax marinus]ATH07035.1 hypothetical protein BIY24_03510 [Halobacteriovorax marinus]CBW25613.1 putative membrane protein [Halobacteriovorax marinus SJ]
MINLYKRELKESLGSPLFYILCAIFIAITGWIFYYSVVGSNQMNQSSLTTNVLQPLFSTISSLFMFLTPLLTMNSFVEEKNNGTLDLLMRSKLGLWNIILGKYFAHMTLILFMLVLSLMFPLILMFSGYTDWGVVLSSYLGLILNISAYVVLGMFASSISGNQIVSGFISFALIFGVLLLNLAANSSHNFIVGQILNYLNNQFHFASFIKGSIRSFSFVYFISFIAVAMLFINKSLSSRRW